MSQENVELVQRLYDDFLGRPERVASPESVGFFDPDVEIRQSAAIIGTEGTFHGHDGLAQAAREVFEVFNDVRYVPKRLTASGDQVVATVEFHARGKGSGVEVRQTVAHVWTLRQGRVVAWHVYLDPVEALEAVGLSE